MKKNQLFKEFKKNMSEIKKILHTNGQDDVATILEQDYFSYKISKDAIRKNKLLSLLTPRGLGDVLITSTPHNEWLSLLSNTHILLERL